MTRAERQRIAVEAQRRRNLRSVAIARNVVRGMNERDRLAALANFERFMAMTEAEPSAAEKQRAREVLATDPQAPQGHLFQGAR